MKDDKKLELLLERFYQRYNKYNTKVLKKMGEIIKKFDGITPTVAHQIAQELKYGYDVDNLIKELAQISEKSAKDIYVAFDEIAKENNDFAEIYAKAKNMEFVNYKDNEQLKYLVKAISKETAEEFINISNTSAVGMTMLNPITNKKVFKPLKQVYNDLIDEAVLNVSTGVKDYQSAMSNITRQLAQSGVKQINYESGYARRVDSSVRQSVLTGVRKVNMQVQEYVGEKYGADGVEISAHGDCAEDHLHVQGKQYSKKEFERVNSSLDRPIGEYNCRHFVFRVVLGVNQPSYTRSQLRQLEQESLSKVEYEGNTYTKYEATQVQRKLETAIRQQKDNQIIARASGNKEEVAKAQQKISQLTQKYNDFSQVAGLDTYKKRLTVSGYKRISVK